MDNTGLNPTAPKVISYSDSDTWVDVETQAGSK